MGKHIRLECSKGCGYNSRSSDVRAHESICKGPFQPCKGCRTTLQNLNNNRGAFKTHIKACEKLTLDINEARIECAAGDYIIEHRAMQTDMNKQQEQHI